MNFNYYSFYLRGVERIYYTSVTHDSAEEILDWAVRFNFIHEEDVPLCSNARLLPEEEVKQRNAVLYGLWWDKHKDSGSLSGRIPPTIGEVLLN